ncbi:MAG: helix-turn-helix domain-containing protein [Candidatus Moraniibacteriota bacterium]|jgi:sugar-specific transcriptional regulator TrmB
MSQKIKKYLRELGFSKNEQKIYIALTELGEASASIIAKKSRYTTHHSNKHPRKT